MELDLPSWYGLWCTCSVDFDCGLIDGHLIYIMYGWYDHGMLVYGLSLMYLCCNIV
ncbi:hypothetical protein Lalb_Chr13g0291801 [Lupinus albus]|uniref:Uncharacterized protein n=1 Tax=Lupinus albus TaxID=3870 RepID=A0A6A4PHE5_LUPAL|nr:hypothetical protein Lalb_Chr13g0291801 [Lupinus albus]